ncbi:argininosuccinate lyase [Paenibacillus apiarius]|uniref:argininosuccinate lyase n=1 Tax=Paenibacillus apiarius TaxID=46240 RepID=A0ABT4DUV3_9BACL|nr:lyase family protein [Paenibacillus apiarius]MCY9517572.1 lyase family protein [Paenibacillus apiarius]MCY9519781.1 lyase family protein [Paenibacillus apiarius]MCY9555016.1 lyase family protein [Paenibacillus apiarius]MCY9559334.1 lyase family protein [Paenibacillus apiarius]MCY9682693.1 lyase family protein [Paenibacillus apiarius]
MRLSGRISENPNELLHREILEPQFSYELKHLLPWYILIEKVMLLEYQRLNLLDKVAVNKIAHLLNQVTEKSLHADPKINMSDICFAIEQYVSQRLRADSASWHMDRSRNDVQACAQVMYARQQLIVQSKELIQLATSVCHLATKTVNIPLPGYTHYQTAQIMTPGFYMAAVSEEILTTLEKLLYVYDNINKCPLGAGAMTGVELGWDRKRMATLLGFNHYTNHALRAVASRDWSLQIASEMANFSVFLSRIFTDFIQWGSSEYQFIDLADQFSGISSAMPQKKNFTILERIRGKTAHISAFYFDFLIAQRNTPFTNLVETSKEAGTFVNTMFSTFNSLIKLVIMVIDNLKFNENRTLEVCKRDFFGGFSLANKLTLHANIPFRSAQVIVGDYIVRVREQKLKPEQTDVRLLEEICIENGYDTKFEDEFLNNCFNVKNDLENKISEGSTNPLQVKKMLVRQSEQLIHLKKEWENREEIVNKAYEELTNQLYDR